MQSAVGGGDEAVELAQAKEKAKGTQAAATAEEEDEEQGEDDAAQEGEAGRGPQEGDEMRIETIGVRLAEPGTKGGARDVVFPGEVALRSRVIGMGEVVEDTGDVLVVPAERVCARVGGVGRPWRSYGSCPLRVVLAKPP